MAAASAVFVVATRTSSPPASTHATAVTSPSPPPHRSQPAPARWRSSHASATNADTSPTRSGPVPAAHVDRPRQLDEPAAKRRPERLLAGVDASPDALGLRLVRRRIGQGQRVELLSVEDLRRLAPPPDHVQLEVDELHVAGATSDAPAEVDLRPGVGSGRHPRAALGDNK
jgi:hypothetical protein